AFALLDAYLAAGGNFIDTANNYQDTQSESWIGEWAAERGVRDRIVLATKYTSDYAQHSLGKGNAVNHTGNHKRSLHVSVRDSLARLRTDWIDVLYLHWWDFTTSIEEVMDSLHVLVQQGKVLYLGVSNAPAWVVSAANTYARAHGKTGFAVYQGRWNVMRRDFERDILPMARHFGMALAPWDVLGSGKFQSREEIAGREKKGEPLRAGFSGTEQTEAERRVSEALGKVAAEHGTESVTAVAIAYVMAKAPYVFPVVGGRKVEHLRDNIRALDMRLTPAQVEFLESAQPFDIGYPLDVVGPDAREGKGQSIGMTSSTAFDAVPFPRPVGY
ncbi:aldo/keto reductase, partial [Candidatus Bathyarchaeota archaeon]|nr:aldo/keto reductase [Candidatus Bathyarchaeota archaeon]